MEGNQLRTCAQVNGADPAGTCSDRPACTARQSAGSGDRAFPPRQTQVRPLNYPENLLFIKMASASLLSRSSDTFLSAPRRWSSFQFNLARPTEFQDQLQPPRIERRCVHLRIRYSPIWRCRSASLLLSCDSSASPERTCRLKGMIK